MKTLALKVEERKEVGKKSTKKLRTENKIPGVLYGNGSNLHFSVEEGKLKPLIFTPDSYIVELDINKKVEKAILKDVQFHPVQDNILHIDLIRIDDKHPIEIQVPLRVAGLAIGVQNGGNLMVPDKKIMVRALINKLPDFLEIDVTDLDINDNLKVRDLSFENIELVERDNKVIAQVKMTRAVLSVQEEELEDEVEEGEETEATDGSPEDSKSTDSEEKSDSKE